MARLGVLICLWLSVVFFTPALAQDAEARCGGQNLLTELAASQPDALAEIRKKAAATPNGQGRFWRIDRDGLPSSYLFGTMHVSDPRVLDLPSSVQNGFDKADRLVIEATDSLTDEARTALLAQRPDLMMFVDGTTLSSLMTDEEAQVVEAGLQRYGLGLQSVDKMKPWVLAAMAASSLCEQKRQREGQPVLDGVLARKAEAAGKTLVGLETSVEQMEAMTRVPMAFQVTNLVDTMALGEKASDFSETMIQLYLAGDLAMMEPLLDTIMPASDPAGEAAFAQELIVKRNHTMVDRARAIIAAGDISFIAVGALHLPGEDGIVALLEKDGFTLTPLH